MLTMDVFKQDAFSAISLTMAVDRYGYVPTALGSIPGLIVPVPVATRDVMIERRANAPALIQTSALGTPPKQTGSDSRDIRNFRTRRWADATRVTAEELQGIRAFGSESELQTLQREMARRTLKIKQNFALTKELWLLNLVQGLCSDADGTVIYNWATEFQQTIPAEVPFAFSNTTDTGSVRTFCNQIRRTMSRNLQGLGGDFFTIAAVCDDVFFDGLVTSKEVRDTYKNWSAAEDLRNAMGRPWQPFTFGGIAWINYRGTDDNSTVAVPTGTAKIFPVGAGIFQWAMAPAESFGFVNTLGRDIYSWMVLDRDREMWADQEYYSYPLAVCVQPQALARARAGS